MIELSEIVGQDEAIGRLQRAMVGKRMPHAFLFAGPRGVGRRTCAVALAKTLLCEQPISPKKNFRQACGHCEDCRMLAADSHPDFHLIRKELAKYHDDYKVRGRVMQDLGIDVIRGFLIAPAGRSPSRGRAKVFVVLEAELMSIAAQNSLLKTLEEPPAGVMIILICQKPDLLLPTTRSRCAMVRFGPLPREFVVDKLIEADLPKREAEFWSAFTGGSIGRALQLAADDMYRVKRDLLEALAGPCDPSELGEQLKKTGEQLSAAAVSAAKEADGPGAPPLAKNLATRRAAGAILELIASAFRDALTLRTGAKMPLTHSDQRLAVAALAERFDAAQIAEIISSLSTSERLLWRNINPKIVWDNVAITCSSAAPLRVQ